VHTPEPLHAATVAFFTVVAQLVPHAPQFAVAVLVSVSQPSAATPLQLPKPVLQVNWQVDDAHEMTVAFCTDVLQLVPHAPQWVVVLERLVSQPSSAVGAAGCVQLPNGELQLELHKPAEHDTVATLVLLHARPHAPQLALSVAVASSQPLVGLPSQSPKPGLQLKVHAPAAQPMPLAFCTLVLQSVPQVPQ
jgi:hypothetical protein